MFISSSEINSSSAINHVKSLFYGRVAASDGELRAIEYIQGQLKNAEIKSRVESFIFSPLLLTIFKVFLALILSFSILSLITINFFSQFKNSVMLFSFLILLIALFILIRKMRLSSFYHLGRRNISNNIISEIPAKITQQRSKNPVLIFSAHYDTASLNLVLLISIFFFLIVSSIIALFITDLAFYGIILSTLIILIFFKSSDKSYGSVDNASGVATLIELVKQLHTNPLDNIDLIFIWYGAEEVGLWGSRYFSFKFFNEYCQKYNMDEIYTINIDMIGSYIGVKKNLIKNKRNNIINPILEQEAKKLDITLVKSKILSLLSLSDHSAFREFAKKFKKKPQICFLSSFKSIIYAHSKRDKPDKCKPNVLNNCIKLCFNTVKVLDSYYSDDKV